MENNYYTKFYLGYTVTMPSLYFNRVLLVSKNVEHPDEEAKKVIMGQFGLLREQGRENVMLIKKSVEIAEAFGMGTMPLPKFPNDYFEWYAHFVKTYETKFEVTTVEYHCFFFARKVTEVLVNLSLIQTAIIITTESKDKINLFQEVNSWVKEMNLFAVLLMAPVIMLERHARKGCFEQLKNSIIAVASELGNMPLADSKDANVEKFTNKVDSSLQNLNTEFKVCVEALKG